jgi:hypothetical protein
MFVTGTAATITHIDCFGFRDEKYNLVVTEDLLGFKLKTELELIKTLQIPDTHNWVKCIEQNESIIA